MSRFKKWDIWYADVLFRDGTETSKDRPVLIVGENNTVFVLSMKITVPDAALPSWTALRFFARNAGNL